MYMYLGWVITFLFVRQGVIMILVIISAYNTIQKKVLKPLWNYILTSRQRKVCTNSIVTDQAIAASMLDDCLIPGSHLYK